MEPGSHGDLGRHAVVIGGSIGGLLAARVLSDHYERVSLVERDSPGDDAGPRKGVPQGNHVHVIFGGGARVIEDLYPGFFSELVEAGAVPSDFSRDLKWYHRAWKRRPVSDLRSYWQSRPLLEAHVRRRTRQLERIRFIEGAAVANLLHDADGTRVTGVEVRHADGASDPERIEADLVVDAGGRGSRVPAWLEALGYPPPRETVVSPDLAYASRFYERPEHGDRDWKVLAVYGTPPDGTRTGYIFPVEGGRWLVSQAGFQGDHPPSDDEGYLAFARSLEQPDFYEAVRDARPLTPIRVFKFAGNLRRHYEKLKRFPGGLLVVGDAICSFNPVYGQGMSVCALETGLLARMLEQSAERGKLAPDFALRYFKEAARITANSWLLATVSDFMYPGTTGTPRPGNRFLSWYIVRVLNTCGYDDDAVLRFYRVLHFIDTPVALFRPAMMWKVAKDALGLGAARRSGAAAAAPESA